MGVLKPGAEIAIPCEVKPGPFSEERLISFETIDGPVTGFVQGEELAQMGSDKWCVRARVLQLRGEAVEVMVRGSFFTTNGLANIKREVALAA